MVIYILLLRQSNGDKALRVYLLALSLQIILKKLLTWSCNFDMIIKLSVRHHLTSYQFVDILLEKLF
ncbi:hypothetical protein FHL05_03220 [Lactobacillus halodurans]|uniref:Uncharacterized protein n=1 Tax=Companilactobacillus halodurans TaxID=2584183 RepID=A0A5P0ZV79_9LACO|nr:hypothetical protein [Companilactobacillus halodurans]